ncbi:hypothetical protein RI129_006835 [Pyrocoelia pectoralis]|uniref:RRM domain-containing protein n=1 Tax=Pyrocoelia pectoralis TaxID=417401 RepID=A0AAN7VBG9_9COLE
MDTDSLSFCYEEHFPSYESSDFLDADDDTQNDDKLFEPRYWDWETEQELNGDIALIPMSSGVSTNYLSNSPPVREDIQKIMSEWQELMNEVSELEAFTTDMSLSDESHDITVDNVPAVKSNQRLPGKKIDTTAQCYILNDPSTFIKSEPKEEDSGDSENDFIDVDTVSDQTTPILQAGDLNSLLEQFEATECYQPEPIPTTSAVVVKSESNASPVVETERNVDAPDENKQILDALPRELIMKINASSKRRVVPVIDAMPNKKRSRKLQETSTSSPEVSKPIKTEPIHLDHDYCSQSTPYPKYPQKDSGFESAEEDEQRNILRKQPTVKGADGKLMVSLLKINTIRNSIITENNTKRKLNLEEYKKRRQGVLRSRSNSLSNSPSSSGANSPAIVEDENIRLLKHQQKLMQMAEEVLKTPPKSALVQPPPPVSNTPDPVPEPEPVEAMPPPPRVPPKNIEVKTLVSMGVNTDISITDELLEIKPILQNANTKISDNSLINSVIKNIQKKKLETSTFIPKTTNKSKEQAHGEDKTIVYLDKNRSPVETKNVEIQTEPEVEDTSKHKRKRNTSSSSSSDSSEHKRTYKRSSSNESRSSYSSDSSSSSRSRSRSPRRYNKKYYKKEHERIKEVEERRIVYVGGISSSMSKETLRRRFQIFGPVTNVSVHFREYGDNYGFVTYMHKSDAYKAVEHGNDDCLLPKYDLSFGGRRIFCRTHYSDLDNVQDEKTYASQDDDSFDSLLREAKAKLRKRKSYS